MDYEILSKLYYKDKEAYENAYHSRVSDKDTTFTLPILINKDLAFVVTSREVLDLCQKIYIRNNKLSRLYNRLPSVAINAYLKKSIIEEILLSNDIEGVYSSKRELKLIIKNQNDKANNVKLAKFSGLANKYSKIILDETIPLNKPEDIRELYNEIILPEIEKGKHPDGRIFRKDSVSVFTNTQKEIHIGVNPENEIYNNLQIALEILHDPGIPQIIRIAVFHYLLGYIHPFYDGNGRLSRFISSYLMKQTLNFLVSFRISYVISNNKKMYYDAFKICNDVKNRGDLTPFVILFLEIIYKGIESLISDLTESRERLSYYSNILSKFELRLQEKASKKRSSKNWESRISILYILIQNSLFNDEPMTISELAKAAELSKYWTTKMIEDYINSGLVLKQKSGQSYFYSVNFSDFEEIMQIQTFS